jgi:hypothetical protein
MPRKAFLLRIDDQVLEALQRWANSDLRSLNGQIEYLLREALQRRGAAPSRSTPEMKDPAGDSENLENPPPQ